MVGINEWLGRIITVLHRSDHVFRVPTVHHWFIWFRWNSMNPYMSRPHVRTIQVKQWLFFPTWLAQWGLCHVQVTAHYPVSLFALAVVASLLLLEEIADQIYLKIIPGLLPCTYPHLARQTKTRGGLKLSSSARMTGEGRKQCQAKKPLSKSFANLIITSKQDNWGRKGKSPSSQPWQRADHSLSATRTFNSLDYGFCKGQAAMNRNRLQLYKLPVWPEWISWVR